MNLGVITNKNTNAERKIVGAMGVKGHIKELGTLCLNFTYQLPFYESKSNATQAPRIASFVGSPS
jgi:hypothetical protein